MKKYTIMAAALLLAACGNAPAEKPAEVTHYLNEPVVFDGVQAVAKSAKFASSLKTKRFDNKPEKPQHKFLVVDLTAENVGKEAQSKLPYVQVLDEEGRVFEQLDFVAAYWVENYFIRPNQKFNPLDKVSGIVAFDVPENQNYKLLLFTNSFDSEDEKAKIELKEKPL